MCGDMFLRDYFLHGVGFNFFQTLELTNKASFDARIDINSDPETLTKPNSFYKYDRWLCHLCHLSKSSIRSLYSAADWHWNEHEARFYSLGAVLMFVT